MLARDTADALGRTTNGRIAGNQTVARCVLEGRVRKAGMSVRVNSHLWSETYNANLKATDVFVIQDDVTDRVVATVADVHGVLVRTMAQAIRDTPPEELDSRGLTLRY